MGFAIFLLFILLPVVAIWAVLQSRPARALAASLVRGNLDAATETHAAMTWAWTDARTELGAAPSSEPFVIEYESAGATFRLSQEEKLLGDLPEAYAICEVRGLPALPALSLRVETRGITHAFAARFQGQDADPEFVENYAVTARPSAFGIEFFDPVTQLLVRRSELSFEWREPVLRIRSLGLMATAAPLVRFARDAELLAARWNTLLARVLGLAEQLGFEPVTAAASTTRVTLLGHTIRRGRTWLLELTHDTGEILVRTGEAPHTTLRFPSPWQPAQSIVEALEATDASFATGAYR